MAIGSLVGILIGCTIVIISSPPALAPISGVITVIAMGGAIGGLLGEFVTRMIKL